MTATRFRSAFLFAVALSAGMQIAMWIRVLPMALDPTHLADFVPLFKAAELVWTGKSQDIYQLTNFSHLPFEAAIAAQLAPLGYVKAYVVFLLVNVLLLGLALRKLNLTGIWAFASCAFVPVGFGIATGQDSIVTLFLLSASAAQIAVAGELRSLPISRFPLLPRNSPPPVSATDFAISSAAAKLAASSELAAGAWLGLTLYKPQIGIPICALMFLWRRWRFVAGFLATGSACVVASIATVGWRTFLSYLALLRAMDPRWDTAKFNMVGIRGLLSIGLNGRALLIVSAVFSAALLLYAFVKGRGSQVPNQFAIAIVACCLVSFHLLAYDLAILLVVFEIARKSENADLRWTGLAVFGMASLLRFMPQSLIAIPLLLFFFALVRDVAVRDREQALASPPAAMLPIGSQ